MVGIFQQRGDSATEKFVTTQIPRFWENYVRYVDHEHANTSDERKRDIVKVVCRRMEW